MTAPFCVDGAADEPLAGTAPHRPTWALVEHPGPWGREAVLDAPWPDAPWPDAAGLPVEASTATPPGSAPAASDRSFGAVLQARFDAAGIRPLLARRPGAGERGAPDRPAVVLARYGPGGWVASTRLDATADLLTLDWTALAAAPAAPAGWTDPGPLWGVCTHGTRDACCARLGRPLAAGFDAAEPGSTWELSHSGGHRLAGVVFDLTRGLLHGRVGPADVEALVAARADGTVVRRLLRGAVHRTPALQAAEAALRDRLDEDRLEAVLPVGAPQPLGSDQPLGSTQPLGSARPLGSVRHAADDPGDLNPTVTRWRHLGPAGPATWQVVVAERPLPARPASCGKAPEAAAAWAPRSVTRQV